jgi:hypothetical protein
MSVFYIKTKTGDIYSLTATTDVAFSYRSSNTKFPVEAGYSVTDHSVVENTTLSMSGVITEFYALTPNAQQKSPKEYLDGLRALQVSRQPFTVYLDNKLSPFTNCLFTSIDPEKGQSEGLSGWRVKIGIEQIKIIRKAKASLVQVENSSEDVNADGTPKDDVKDTADGTKDVGSKANKQVPTTILDKGLDFFLEKIGFNGTPPATGGTQ